MRTPVPLPANSKNTKFTKFAKLCPGDNHVTTLERHSNIIQWICEWISEQMSKWLELNIGLSEKENIHCNKWL